MSVFNTELTGNAQLISTAIYGAPFIYGTDLVNDYGAGVGDTSDIEWSPNGTQIASAHNYLRGLNFRMFENQSIAIWDVATGEILYEYQPHIDPITDLEWSPDADSGLLASTALDSTIVIWDVPNNQPAHVLITPFVFDAAWSPDGTQIAAAAADKIYIWELASRSVIREIPLLDAAGYSIDWSADGTRLAFSDGFTVRVVDAATGQDVIVYPVDRVPLQLAWSPQGQLAIPDGGDLEIVTPPLPSNIVLTPTPTHTPTSPPTRTPTPP